MMNMRALQSSKKNILIDVDENTDENTSFFDVWNCNKQHCQMGSVFIILSIDISFDGNGDKRGRHYDSKVIFLGKTGNFNAIFSSMSMGI